MGEPGGLLSMGSHRVGHDSSDLAAAAAGYPGVFTTASHSSILAWRIHGLYSPWAHKESDTTERISLSIPFPIYHLGAFLEVFYISVKT